MEPIAGEHSHRALGYWVPTREKVSQKTLSAVLSGKVGGDGVRSHKEDEHYLKVMLPLIHSRDSKNINNCCLQRGQ